MSKFENYSYCGNFFPIMLNVILNISLIGVQNLPDCKVQMLPSLIFMLFNTFLSTRYHKKNVLQTKAPNKLEFTLRAFNPLARTSNTETVPQMPYRCFKRVNAALPKICTTIWHAETLNQKTAQPGWLWWWYWVIWVNRSNKMDLLQLHSSTVQQLSSSLTPHYKSLQGREHFEKHQFNFNMCLTLNHAKFKDVSNSEGHCQVSGLAGVLPINLTLPPIL